MIVLRVRDDDRARNPRLAHHRTETAVLSGAVEVGSEGVMRERPLQETQAHGVCIRRKRLRRRGHEPRAETMTDKMQTQSVVAVAHSCQQRSESRTTDKARTLLHLI